MAEAPRSGLDEWADVAGVHSKDLKIGGLADQAFAGKPARRRLEGIGEECGPLATHLFIMGPDQHKLALDFGEVQGVAGTQAAGNEAFHVRCSSSVKFAVTLREYERIGTPGLALGGDHIHVTGEDESILILRANGGHDIGFGGIVRGFVGGDCESTVLCSLGKVTGKAADGTVGDRRECNEALQVVN